MGATVFLIVVCVLVAGALTDTMMVGGDGDQWRALLRTALLGAFVAVPLFALGGIALVVRRVFS